MSEETILIEKVSENRIAAIAEVHLHAFSGYLHTRLGRSYVRKFITWFFRSERAIALVALYKNEVVGYVFGAPIGYQQSLSLSLLAPVAVALLRNPSLLLDRLMVSHLVYRISRLWKPRSSIIEEAEIPFPTMSLVAIGVGSSARGKGVGMKLIANFETNAIKRGMKSLRLSVYADNSSARRLYEKNGWALASSTFDNVVYYVKILGRDVSPNGKSQTLKNDPRQG